MSDAPMNWFVQVNNQNYGPYTEEQLQTYVSEGRITAQSLISNDLRDGFFTADQFENLGLQTMAQRIALATGRAATGSRSSSRSTQSAPAPSNVQVQPTGLTSPHQTSAGQERSSVFLVMAEINSDGGMAFLQALQSFGTAERISNTVWLLRSLASVEQLRNRLSQSLNRQDRLFILGSGANKSAWFNIGADLDHRLRDLWQDDKS